MASTTDGFALAERDFELRREGDVLGLAQSGLPRAPGRDAREPPTTASWPPAPGPTPRRSSARTASSPMADRRWPHELAAGWLRNVFAGDPASAA